MKFSIITATYNSEATIARAMCSVLSQEAVELEYILIDGNSRDSTVSVIEANIDSRCQVVSEPDEGIYDALNKGVLRASGEVIAFLHSDDQYAHQRVLAEVAELFDSRPSALGVYGNLTIIQKHDSSRVVRRWRAGRCTLGQLYLGWMPPHPTLFLQSSVYKSYGLFNTQIGSAADYDFILRVFLAEMERILLLDDVLVLMQAGGASDSSPLNRLRSLLSDLLSWHRNSTLFNPFLVLTKPLRKILQFF